MGGWVGGLGGGTLLGHGVCVRVAGRGGAQRLIQVVSGNSGFLKAPGGVWVAVPIPLWLLC